MSSHLQLHAVLFRSWSAPDWEQLAAVWQRSVAAHSPAAAATLHRIEEHDRELVNCAAGRSEWIRRNTRKTKHHCELVQQAPLGSLLGLLDADTMVLGELSEVAALDFDLAYTVSAPGASIRINSGVVFVRVSPQTRAFYLRWLAAVIELAADQRLHARWQPTHGGVNQSALGWLLAAGAAERLKLLELPADVWNNATNDRPRFSAHTKVVHCCGHLRGVVLRRRIVASPIELRLQELFQGLLKEARAAAPPKPVRCF